MEFNKHTREYWEEKDLLELEQAESVGAMLAIAFRVLKRMPQPIGQVCGPISTGGRGSLLENLIAFNETIVELQAQGAIIFDQMPFEEPIQRVKAGLPLDRYPTILLDEFYLPIFETGMVKKVYFMPDWESSYGARWEHEQAQRLGIEIVYLETVQ